MTLFDQVVEIPALPDPDRLQLLLCLALQAVCRVIGHDRLPIGRAAIDDDPLGPAMSLQRSRQKVPGSIKVSRSQNQNSTASALLSMARYKDIQRPRTLM